MSIDLSKIGFGVISTGNGGGGGVVISKIGYGAIFTGDGAGQGIVLSKIGYGVIVGPALEPRRRQMGCLP